MMIFKMIGKRTCKGCDWKQIHTTNYCLSSLIDNYEELLQKQREDCCCTLRLECNICAHISAKNSRRKLHEALKRAVLFLINFILYHLPETVTMNSIQTVQ